MEDVAFQRAVGLNMTRGGMETGWALIEVAVDLDIFKLLTLETSLIVTQVITSKGCIMVAACSPDFSVGRGITSANH